MINDDRHIRIRKCILNQAINWNSYAIKYVCFYQKSHNHETDLLKIYRLSSNRDVGWFIPNLNKVKSIFLSSNNIPLVSSESSHQIESVCCSISYLNSKTVSLYLARFEIAHRAIMLTSSTGIVKFIIIQLLVTWACKITVIVFSIAVHIPF